MKPTPDLHCCNADFDRFAAGSPRCRGVAMVMVMIALTVGTIITLSFLASQTTSTAIAHNATRQVQARAIAEDGLRLAMEYLRATPEWRDEHTHGLWAAATDLNGGSFRVMFEDEDDADLGDDVSEAFVITVEGTFNGVVHRISNRVVPAATSSTMTVLLVTGNAYHADEDLERIAVIESWGYRVLTVTDSDPQAVYDAAAAQADVIYISEESASSSVSTKTNGYDIGVVNEEHALQDELGMSTSGGGWTGSTIEIVDNAHPITSGFALGDLQITYNSTGLIQSGGTPASGLNTLAERVSSSTAVLTYLDIGDTMTDGNPSPQRRVTMPFGSNKFEYGQLNDDGKKLMKQAVDWAAGGATVSTVSPISRWTLDETVGSLATDVVGGHHGSYATGTTLGVGGQVDAAAEFDGSSGHVAIDHNDAFLADAGAITLWFYLDNTSGRKELFSKDSSGYDTGGHVTMYANGDDVEVRFQDTSSSYTLNSGNVLSASTWHHAALTFGAGGLRLYVDGALVDSDSHTGGMGTSSGGTGNFEPIALGANTWASGNLTLWPMSNYLDGRLDDVRFYDQQLTADQVAALFTSGEAASSDADGTTPSLLALYEFHEPDAVVPQLVSHWKLDDTATARGQAVAGGRMQIQTRAKVDSYDSGSGDYDTSQSDNAFLSTNQTADDSFSFWNRAQISGDIYGGPGGVEADIFDIHPDHTVLSGAKRILPIEASFAFPATPSLPLSTSFLKDNWGDERTISSDIRYGAWNVENYAKITIDGDITIVVDGDMTFNRGRLFFTAGSSLRLFVGGNFNANDESLINADSLEAERLTIYVPNASGGSRSAYFRGTSITAATVYSGGNLSVSDDATFYGTLYTADYMNFDSDALVRLDRGTVNEGGVALAIEEVARRDGGYVDKPTGGLSGFGDGGTSVEFDGVDDFVEVPHDPTYLLDRGTLSFWFRPSDISGTQGMVSKDATNYATGGHIRVYLNGSQLECRLQSTSASKYVRSASGAVSANTWHHVAVGFGAEGLRLYLNGVLVDSDSYTGGLGPSSGGVGNEEPWTFGVDQRKSSSGTTDGWDLPYHGRLDDVRLYDQNLNADQAADLYAKTDPRDAMPALVYDTSEKTPALDLAIADPDHVTWISGGGLTIDTATTISSGGPVDRLHTAIIDRDAISVEAVFTPANITQDGPARIVSYSNGTSNRNFHLGQTDAKYNVRLRTEFNTSGTPEAESGDVLVADTQQHVIFTYDPNNEELRVYRNGTLEITETWTGDLDNWNSGYELLLANEVGGSRGWLGTLHRVAIYDGTFNRIQAENVFNGSPPGDGTGGEGGLAYEAEWLESP